MVEVKSSTCVKDYHLDDTAIQAYVARYAGVPLPSVTVAHIESTCTYPGAGDYTGLLVEVDITLEALAREGEVRSWV